MATVPAAMPSGADAGWAAAAGAFLGALAGSWLDGVHPAGGTWVFALSLVGGAVGAVSCPAGAGRHEREHCDSMPAMACSSVGGLMGALLGAALYFATPARHGGHGTPVLAPSDFAAGPFSAQWAALNMYLMNGAMGGMIGGSLPDCPSLRAARRFLTQLLRGPRTAG